MARIAGVDLPPQKRLWVGLTSIYGIGQVRAKAIAEKANVDHFKKVRDLTEDEVNRLRTVIEQEGRVEGDLRTAPTSSPTTRFAVLHQHDGEHLR